MKGDGEGVDREEDICATETALLLLRTQIRSAADKRHHVGKQGEREEREMQDEDTEDTRTRDHGQAQRGGAKPFSNHA